MMKLFVLLLFVFIQIPFSLAAQKSVSAGYVFVDQNNNGIKDKNEPGLKDVAVSDQFTVVKTNADGYYQFSNTKGYGFLFLSIPSGYKPLQSNWMKVPQGTSELNFPLVESNKLTTFKFIHASDTHISEASVGRVNKLRRMADSLKVDFVIITGDLVKDALRVSEKIASAYYELYKNEIQKFTMPVWSVPGNHENFGIERHLSLVSKENPLYGKKMFRSNLGPNYYSFNDGGVHFVGLDDVDFEDLWYFGHVDSTQFSWLAQDLASIPKGMPVVTFNHIPFFSGGLSMTTFSEEGLDRTLEREKGVLQFRHVVSNAHELIDLLSKYNYPLALSGHYHIRQLFSYETTGQKIRFEQTAAIVGPSQEHDIKFPSGFTLYSVKDGKIDEGKFIRLD